MKREGWLFFILCLVFFPKLAYNQNVPVYSHFYNNPYLENPAEAGNAMQAFAAVTRRQQWLGIDGAPVVTTLTYHNFIDGTKTAYGLKVSSFSRGLLSTNDVLLSYVYSVALQKELKLNFGLSAGLTSNNVDIANAAFPDDPAIAGYLQNNLQPAGNFGIKLASNGINIGLSLPQLFGQSFINTSNFSEVSNISPFDHAIATIYYRKKLSGKKGSRSYNWKYRRKPKAKGGESYAPLELYGVYRYHSINPSQFELLGKLNLNQFFWFGLSYKQGHGISGNTGFNINDFTFSYGYDPSFNQVSSPTGGSHEIQLSIRFGKKKKYWAEKKEEKEVKKPEPKKKPVKKEVKPTPKKEVKKEVKKETPPKPKKEEKKEVKKETQPKPKKEEKKEVKKETQPKPKKEEKKEVKKETQPKPKKEEKKEVKKETQPKPKKEEKKEVKKETQPEPKKEVKKEEVVEETGQNETQEADEPVEPVERPINNDEGHNPRYVHKDELGTNRQEDAKRHIVYLKTFRDFQSADNFRQQLRRQYKKVDIYQKDNLLYVYVFEFTKLREAKKKVKKLIKTSKYKNAKVLTIEDD